MYEPITVLPRFAISENFTVYTGMEARFRRKTLKFLKDAHLGPTTERILPRTQQIFEGENCHRYGE